MEQNLKQTSGTSSSASFDIGTLLESLDREHVREWFARKLEGKMPYFYNSVDIRNSGTKIAPVDTNIFPAGFNNLSSDSFISASEQVRIYIESHYPGTRLIGLLPENFSRNLFYWDNIAAISSIIHNAGYDVVILTDSPEVPSGITSNNGSEITIHQITLKEGIVSAGGKTPDLLIANRDFTSGIPEILANAKQPIIPPVSMGWHRRRKSNHFTAYDRLAGAFAKEFGFDPWLITTLHNQCGEVDFKKREGVDCVALAVEKTLSAIRTKYNEYGINQEPYVFMKSDSGTFGMGIMTFKSGAEVFEMNKKDRNKMDRIKEGIQSTEVIIQEGVPTIELVNGKPAEPFVYLINAKPVGAILRINSNRDKFDNLNSAGMTFEPIECAKIANPCDFSAIGIIGRLAAIAALDEDNDAD